MLCLSLRQPTGDSTLLPTDARQGLGSSPRNRPKGGVRWFYDNCAYPPGLFHYLVDFDLRRNVVSNGELGRTWATERDPRIMSNALSRPKRESQTRLQVKERNCPILELCADNAFGPQAKAITLEADGPLQIINTDGKDSYTRFHINV